MPSGWIERRFANYQKKIADQEEKKAWATNAQNAYPSKFQELRDRIVADIKESNHLFPRKIGYADSPDGISVYEMFIEGEDPLDDHPKLKSVKIKRAHSGTVIAITRITGETQESDHIDVVPDDKGRIRYKHKDQLLADVHDASEAVIGKLLP